MVEKVRDRLTLLITLNVFQPLTFDEIKSGLSKQIKGADVEQTLASLIDSGYIIKIGNGYIVSQRGLNVLTESSLKKRRDIQRMLYLSGRSKRG